MAHVQPDQEGGLNFTLIDSLAVELMDRAVTTPATGQFDSIDVRTMAPKADDRFATLPLPRRCDPSATPKSCVLGLLRENTENRLLFFSLYLPSRQ
jgi:hypothetical protein